MKKLIGVFALVLVAVSLFSACNSTSINSALGEMSHQADVETLLSYLSEGELDKAKDMMHTDKEDTSKLQQISDFLNGRKVDELKTQNVNVKTQRSNGASSKQESATFKLTLDDGETTYLTVIYLENGTDKGFASFQLVLGVV